VTRANAISDLAGTSEDVNDIIRRIKETIEPEFWHQAGGMTDSNFGRLGDANQIDKIGDAGIRTSEKASFTTHNDNGEIYDVFGFDFLQHKEGGLWELKKPYRNIYRSDFKCYISADKGSIQVETGAGSTTTRETFNDNVMIHMIPGSSSDIKETKIYLDELVFLSDRSQLVMGGPATVISEDIRMGGSGYGKIPPEILKIQSAIQEHRAQTAGTGETPAGKLVNRVYDISDLAGTVDDVNNLIRRIKDIIEPESWYKAGGGGIGTITAYPSEQPKKLAVYQSFQVHQKILQFLDIIRPSSGEEFISPPEVTFPKNWEEIKKQAESPETEMEKPELSNQILIETKILKVGDEFLEYVGLDANSLESSETWSKYLVNDSGDSARFVLDPLNVDLLLKTAAARKDSKMLIAPRVHTMDGKQAKIQIITEEYYLLTTTDELESFKAGTFINLTPKVTEDKKNIRLDCELEIRWLKGSKEQTPVGNSKQFVPEIVTYKNTSRTLVPDGGTLLIRGEKITEFAEGQKSVPILGDLPVIGEVFRSQYKIADQRTPLLLVTPIYDPQKKAQAMRTPKPEPLDPNDPLIEQLDKKLSRSATDR